MAQELSVHRCAQVGDTDNLLELIDKGANINAKDEDERTALHWACSNGKMAVVEMLLDNSRVEVNTQDDGGWSPLMSSVSAGHSDIVILLLSKGADINVRNESGSGVIHYHKGDVEMLSQIIDKVENVNAIDKYGTTALHKAAGVGTHKDALELLLRSGADLNIQNAEGNTPLHLAVIEQQTENALILVKGGADVQLQNKDNRTPLQLATRDLEARITSITGGSNE